MKTMKNILTKTIATCATVGVVLASGIAQTAGTALAYNAGIEAFVNSLYSDCLGRNADPTGFNDWCNKLATGQITGKQAAYGFFFSPEFLSRANSSNDSDLIDAYYRVFLNRSADTAGKTYWTQQIAGTDRNGDVSVLFTGFADSTEFADKCASYGITVGSHVDVPTAAPSASTSASTSTTGNLAQQTNGVRANSVEELDAYWNSLGYETFYIDLGNGNTQKCYAKFFDPSEHCNQVNAWRNEQGIPSLAVISDPNDVRYQWARRRAVEVAYFFSHLSPKGWNENNHGTIEGTPSGEQGENIYGGNVTTAYNGVPGLGAFEAFRTSGLHAAGMRRGHSMVVASAQVAFVQPDGVSVYSRTDFYGNPDFVSPVALEGSPYYNPSIPSSGESTVQLFYE